MPTHLIMSDGTSFLRFLDPKTFRESKRIHVTDNAGHSIEKLNELEYIHGQIYANIWQSDTIVRISPHTGKVIGWLDLSRLINKHELGGSDAVLNGIAYDGGGDRIFVTGKLWLSCSKSRLRRRSNLQPVEDEALFTPGLGEARG
jgi:glutamine cyclotransferase